MTAAPDVLAPGSAAVMVLLGARVAGLVAVAPAWSARTVPVRLRAALLVLLTVLLQPAALASAAAAPAITPAVVLGEALVGIAMGLGAAVLVGAAESAGEMMAVQMGLSGAALDPSSEQPAAPLGQFAQLFAVALLLSVHAHEVMLDALSASTRAVPVGAPVDAHAGLGALLGLGGSLFALGLRFAAPVIAAVLVANLALAVLGRAAPTINLLALAFPVQILVGLLALAAALPLIAAWLAGWPAGFDGTLTPALGAFAGARGR